MYFECQLMFSFNFISKILSSIDHKLVLKFFSKNLLKTRGFPVPDPRNWHQGRGFEHPIWNCTLSYFSGYLKYFCQIFRPNLEPTVNNKKIRTPCFSTLRFSRMSPEPLKLQKIYLHFFISVFKELSAGTQIFQIR